MGNATHWMRLATACAAILCVPALAHASGWMPIMDLSVKFKTHQECVAALEAAYAEDLKRAEPLTVEANGNRHEVSLESKGVERLGSRTARYESRIWYHNGGLRTDLEQIETSHSYRHPIRQCNGKILKTSGDMGYTLSTFEPVDPRAIPEQ